MSFENEFSTTTSVVESMVGESFVSIGEKIWNLALQRPEAFAVLSEKQRLTFGELADRVDVMQSAFRGILERRRGAPIAICTDDPAQFVITALACWKAGSPYLPIAPNGPSERILHMLDESQTRIVVRKASASVPNGVWAQLVIEDFVVPSNANLRRAVQPTAWDIRPAELAYIIYTSGSTGSPKGVAITHGNLAPIVEWFCDAFGLTEQDRITQTAALTFDAAVLEIWPALLKGATLFIPGSMTSLLPEELRDYAVQECITVCFASTAIVEQLLGLEWPQETKLRYLTTGGDTLRRYPPPGLPFQLVNNYGPTECTVAATSGIVPAQYDAQQIPSIGWPVRGANVFLLDPEMRPVPDGERGEIYIGGVGVGAGYIGRPELTKDRFVPNPFAPGSHLYRTGDLGERLPNGSFQFCGRLDDQVKIRGYRIEPGEIVTALQKHPAVRAAAVIAIGEHADKQLNAYVVLNHENGAVDFRGHLSRLLPAYMIPDRFICLDQLPLTAHGKVDRAALLLIREPRLTSSEAETSSAIRTDGVTQKLTRIWEDLLGVSSISLDDNFFHLGGHSLTAARLFSLIHKEFGTRIPLATIFEAPTIRELATVIQNHKHPSLMSSLVALRNTGSAAPLFLLYPFDGNPVMFKELASCLSDRPIYGVDSRQFETEKFSASSFERIAANNIRAIRSVQGQGPYYLGGYCLGGLIAFEMALKLHAAGEDVAFLGLIDCDGQASSLDLIRKGRFRDAFRRQRYIARWHLHYRRPFGIVRFFYRKVRQIMVRIALSVSAATDNRFTLKKASPTILREAFSRIRGKAQHRLIASTVVFRTAESLCYSFDETLGWSELVSGDLEIENVPGDHNTLLRQPQVQVLASKLAAKLSRAASQDSFTRETNTLPAPAPSSAQTAYEPMKCEADA